MTRQNRTPSQVSDTTGASNPRRRRASPANPGGDKTTKCTRDEDINIEEFMREDMSQLNKEEDQLQREIKQMHLKNIHKHANFNRKHKIDTGI